MTSPWLYALTVGPLGFYLWVLALWQSGRHPRVVRGLVDFGLLAFGVGGLLAFGPFGQVLVRMISNRPDLFDRLVVVSLLGLFACVRARRALRRMVVYHVDPDRIAPALADVVAQLGGRFVRTLGGFEDASSRRGFRVDFSRGLRCAVIEAHGVDAEGLVRQVRPLLEQRLMTVTTRPSSIAPLLYGCSVLVMLAPLVGLFVSHPRAIEVLRVLLQKLQGG